MSWGRRRRRGNPLIGLLVIGALVYGCTGGAPRKSTAGPEIVQPATSSATGGRTPSVTIDGAAPAPSRTAPPSGKPGQVWVDGYYRKDGTYVQGHWRSR